MDFLNFGVLAITLVAIGVLELAGVFIAQMFFEIKRISLFAIVLLLLLCIAATLIIAVVWGIYIGIFAIITFVIGTVAIKLLFG